MHKKVICCVMRLSIATLQAAATILVLEIGIRCWFYFN